MSRTLTKPPLPRRLTESSVRAYKSRMRAYDRARIALRLSSASTVQRENSLFSPSQKIKVLTFPEGRGD